MKRKKHIKVCMVSSSGGHYEQLSQLSPLMDKYDGFRVTEKTEFSSKADYYMPVTDSKDKLVLVKLAWMMLLVVRIWIKERPTVVVSTGALIAIPFMIMCKLTGCKFVFIETFARVSDGSKTGKLAYKFADLFIYQWEPLKEVYPKGIYGGSIY